MKCPFCNHEDTLVIDTRLSENKLNVKRRRKCSFCERRFNTYEKIELEYPIVVKGDNRREEYLTEKLKTSLLKALHKRKVPIDKIDQAIENINSRVLLCKEREISSRIIGDLVMEELIKLDKVAYIRFASVYRSFQDVTDFTQIIKQVKD